MKNGKKWYRDIRVVMLLEIGVLAAGFAAWLRMMSTSVFFSSFVDLPALLGILLIAVVIMIVIGEWRDFLRAFSIDAKSHTLLELKNICGSVAACQKLVAYTGTLLVVISLITLMHNLNDPSTIGPNCAVALLSCFYAVLLEVILLPLRIRCEQKMNAEIDMEYEDSAEAEAIRTEPENADAHSQAADAETENTL